MAEEKAGKTKPVPAPARKFKLYEPKEGTTRWVQPIEEIPFRVELRFLADEEQSAIFDRHKIYPGSKSNTMLKLGAAALDLIDAKVIDWEHPESVFPGEPPDYPCAGINKHRLQNVFFKRDGDENATVLWRMIVEAEEKALEDERKN